MPRMDSRKECGTSLRKHQATPLRRVPVAYSDPMRGVLSLEVGNQENEARIRTWFHRWFPEVTGINTGGCGCCVRDLIVEAPTDAINDIPPELRGDITTYPNAILTPPKKNPFPGSGQKAKDRNRRK